MKAIVKPTVTQTLTQVLAGAGTDAPPVPLQWNNTSGRAIIAQQSGSFVRFGVPSNSATTSGVWQWRLTGGGSWSNFAGPFTVIDVGAPLIQVTDGSLFRYIHVSSNWTSGNTTYEQRIYPSSDVAGNGYSYGETAALANNTGNFGTASNYSFF